VIALMYAVLTTGLLAGPNITAAIVTDNTRETEQAYAYNRDGMIDMSEARFDEAIEQFQHAADLVPDYGITRRDLRYTPNFMIGWAHEKQGRIEEACRAYRRFLDLAPAQLIEQGKADHANQYFDRHCPALKPPHRSPQVPQAPQSDDRHGL
jgi:tetratricopeptide (TPR) repeat protein